MTVSVTKLMGTKYELGPSFAVSAQGRIRLNDAVSVRDFGAVGDGIADDTAAIQALFDALKSTGGIGVLPPGTYCLTSQIFSADGSKPYTVIGYGATLKRASDSIGTPVEIRSTNGIRLEGFAIDAGHDTLPNGNHGLVVLDCNNAALINLAIENYKNSAILAYATTAGTISGVVIDGVRVDGRGVANNGILVANIDKAGMRRCRVVGATGSPGYGLQLKNAVSYGFIEDSYAENCKAGVAFGNDTNVLGVQFARVTSVTTVNCTNGLNAGYSEHCHVSGLLVDMTGALGTNDGVRLEAGCNFNAIDCTVLNTAAGREAVRIMGGQGNVVRVRYLKKASGAHVGLDAGSANNVVVVDQLSSYANALTIRNDSGGATNSVGIGRSPVRYVGADISGRPVLQNGLSGASTQSGATHVIESDAAAGTVLQINNIDASANAASGIGIGWGASSSYMGLAAILQTTGSNSYWQARVNSTNVLRIYTSSLRPETDNSVDLGSTAIRYRALYGRSMSLLLPASVTPATNGEMMIELTSNTSLTFKVKGSDGTVRSAALTLS